ncbi:unnamed protein product [Phytophthora lilii]|uniref:Unnamed protein product n=1 Tax=Phytophthora lilii TaxID=2077276 RepID=A0A9W6X2M4_9STRA|nr:unnamed protein product [Phytophthora lilii]
MPTAVTTGGGDAAVLSASLSTLPLPHPAHHGQSDLRKDPPAGPCILPAAHLPRMAPLRASPLRISQSSPRLVGTSVVEKEAAAVAVDHDVEVEDQSDDGSSCSETSSSTSSANVLIRRATSALESSSDHTSDESIMYAVALLRRLQQHACENERGEAAVQREELDQILHGFSRALETVTSTWDERSVENTMQKLFDTHSNVFDESMQNFFIQNFLHESESAKTLRTALRRTSMLRRCLLAMYQSENTSASGKRSSSLCDDKGTAARRWSEAVARIMKQKEEERHRYSIEVCPEITNPSIVLAVKNAIANVDSWSFDVFEGHTSYSNNFHITVNDELAVQYVYRSPLEHMHCALAFQLMKDPQCNILQGLTKIEQHEVGLQADNYDVGDHPTDP